MNFIMNNKSRKECLKTAFISFVIMVASQNEFAFNYDVKSKEAQCMPRTIAQPSLIWKRDLSIKKTIYHNANMPM